MERTRTSAIVVGYDGSDAAGRALERAARAVGEGESITVVSVVSRPSGPGDAREHARRLEEAGDRLADLGVSSRGVEGAGDAAGVLGEQVRKVGAGLVVVGSGDRALLERLLVDSAAGAPAGRPGCDVLVVG